MVCAFFGSLVVNSTAIPVALLQWDRALKLMQDLGWVTQILLIIVFLVFRTNKNKSLWI